MLAKFVHSRQASWASYLDTCVFAYNTSRHESTKFTPFEIMFSRQATLPIDIELGIVEPEDKLDVYAQMEQPDMTELQKKRTELLECAKQNILSAQEKQKTAYERKHSKLREKFQVGQMVLKKDFTRKKRIGGKLDLRFKGPYTIVKVLPRGSYELSSTTGTSFRVCGAHLKLYHRGSVPLPPI